MTSEQNCNCPNGSYGKKHGADCPLREVLTSKDVAQGPWWTPTVEVERLMRECKANLTSTVAISRDKLEGLLHDSLLWRQDRLRKPLPQGIATRVVEAVCELPDYTSPDDQPDLLTCTVQELEHCVLRAFEQLEYDREMERGPDSTPVETTPAPGSPGEILGCRCIMCEFHRSAEAIEREKRAVEPTPVIDCTACPHPDACEAAGGCYTGKCPRERGDLPAAQAKWMDEARGTLNHLASFLQAKNVPYRVDWRDWIDEARRVLPAYSPEEPSQHWQPIETAPNDVSILVWRSPGHIDLVTAEENDYSWRPYVADGLDRPTHWRLPPNGPEQHTTKRKLRKC